MLETAQYECPYCGEEVETTVDLSGGDLDLYRGLPGVLSPDNVCVAG